MINNKGYAFTTLIVVLILFSGLVVLNTKLLIKNKINNAELTQSIMDNNYFTHLKKILVAENELKQEIYFNLSHGLPINTTLIIKDDEYIGDVNMSFNNISLNISYNYPLNMKVKSEQIIVNVQNCLYSSGCEESDDIINLLITCLDKEKLIYDSVIWVKEGVLVSNIRISGNGTLFLYPFIVGNHIFSC